MPFPFKRSRALFFDRSRAFFIIINSRIELEQNNYERFDMCLSQNLEIMRTTYSS